MNSLCHIVVIIHLGYLDNHGRYARDDSSASDDGGDSQSTVFIIGSGEYLNQIPPVTPTTPQTPAATVAATASTSVVTSVPLASNINSNNHNNSLASSQINSNIILTSNSPSVSSNMTSAQSVSALSSSQNSVERLVSSHTQARTLDPPFYECRHSIQSTIHIIIFSAKNKKTIEN